MRSSRPRLQTFHSCRSQQQQPDFPPQVGSCRVCGPRKEQKKGTQQLASSFPTAGCLTPPLAFLSPRGSSPCKPEVQALPPSFSLLKSEVK